jgi:hypothetical protein
MVFKSIIGAVYTGLAVVSFNANAMLIDTSIGQYDVTTVTGEYSVYADLLQSQVWWNDIDLATEFLSLTAGYNELGFPNADGNETPLYAYDYSDFVVSYLYSATLDDIVPGVYPAKQHTNDGTCYEECVWGVAEVVHVPAPLILDDGGTYSVNYTVSDGIKVTNGSTLYVQDGALISSSDPDLYWAIDSQGNGTVNIQGGRVTGTVYISSEFNMSGGTIERRLEVNGGQASISGGIVSSIFSEGGSSAHLDISGGTFGNIKTLAGSYDISGGTFLEKLHVFDPLAAYMNITGGSFSGGFSYDMPSSIALIPTFTFFGNLSLSTPVLIDDTTYPGLTTYETTVSGTLLDGSFISQTITCNDNASDSPCSGVAVSSDDPRPGELSFELTNYSVSENGNTVELTVNRVNGSNGEVFVNFSSSDGTATASVDYQSINGALTFADGVTSQTVEVMLLDDSTYEGDETFTVSLSNVQGNATLGSISTVQVIIEENDPAPASGVFQFSGASYDIKENDGSVIVTVQRVNGSFGDVSVDYNTTDSTATASVDYQPVSGSLTFADGVIGQTIEVSLIDDTTYEGEESFSVELSNAQGGATLDSVSSAQVVIEENDPAPPPGVLQFSEATYSVGENNPNIIVTVTRVNGSFGETSVNYITADLIAVAGEDYQSTSGNLVFTDGETSRTIKIALLNDMTYEGDESFAIELNNVQGGATLGNVASTQIVINEDDPVPPSGALRFSGASYSTNENDGSVIITVQRDSGSFGEVSVNYSTADLIATAGEDYQLTSGILTFSDGETSRIIEVALLDDIIFEGEETFTVELSNVQGGAVLGGISSAQVVINEDDPVPPYGVLQFSGSNYSVDENGVSVVVAIMRVNGSFGEVSVDYNTADLIAVAGEDYQSVSGTLFFADGETSRAIAVTIVDDMVFEGNETFRVLLSNVQNGAVMGIPESSVITIKEDDVNTENDDGATDSSDTIKSSGVSSMGPLLLVFLLLGFIARIYAVAHYHRVHNSHTWLTRKVSKNRV